MLEGGGGVKPVFGQVEDHYGFSTLNSLNLRSQGDSERTLLFTNMISLQNCQCISESVQYANRIYKRNSKHKEHKNI